MTCNREVITFRKVKCVKLHDAVMELMVVQGRDRSPSLGMCHIMSSLSAQSTCLVNGDIPLSPISKSFRSFLCVALESEDSQDHR